MNKRLAKRHKRQVAREKHKVRLSGPDVRTPEQLAAAREASRAVSGRSNAPHLHYSARPARNPAAPTVPDAERDVGGM
ncbi:MAG TPA: hypothetical protein VKU19_19950 [Bryobacteraceae bacterium]|nr:hypothetical protein [Bryobacteraceae bacterium]